MKKLLIMFVSAIALVANADWVNEYKDLEGGTLEVGSGLYSNNSGVIITNSVEDTQAEIVINNPSESFSFTGKIVGNIKVVKKGTGVQQFKGSCLYAETEVMEGTFYVDKEEAFGSWDTAITHKITIHEGTTFKSYRHLPLGEVVLKGGTLLNEMYSANVFNQTSPVSIVDPSSNYRAWALKTVTVEASETPSVIRAFTTCLAHGPEDTVFNVAEGAELQLDVELFPGKLTATQLNEGGFIKRGKGTLKLLKPCNLNGTILVEDGVVVVSKNTWHNPTLKIITKGDGKIVMEDEAALVCDTAEGLLASADIWVDAAQHQAPTTGNQISFIKNLGTAGGVFRPLLKSAEGGTCVGPDFKPDGINGLPSFAFNKWRGMGLDTYTNKTANLTVFMVTRWDAYDVKNSGSASFSTKAATAEDSKTPGSFHWERGSDSVAPLKGYFGTTQCTIENTGVAIGTPTIKMASRTATSLNVWSYVNDSAEPTVIENTGSFGELNIDTVAFGSRLGANGLLKANGQNMNGLIGEMIAFSRPLSDDEIETIQTYLKRKWCASTAEQQTANFDTTEALHVEVADNTKAVVMNGASTRNDVMSIAAIKKSGGGTLALGAISGDKSELVVEEGTLELKDGKTLPHAEIWMDANDTETVTFYEHNNAQRVAGVRNKGRTGGEFEYRSDIAHGPLRKTGENGLNGKAVLDFSMWNALTLNTYTNKNTLRNLHVYAVVRKPVWNEDDKKGSANAGPFSFSRVDTGDGKGDGEISGTFHIRHATHTQDCTTWTNIVDCGDEQYNVFDRAGTNEAYVVICHATNKGLLYTQVMESDETIELPVCSFYNNEIESLEVDLVQIGGRLGPDGGKYGNNRLWQGQMGEFIVFNQKPTVEQETELINYLRKKWFNKGDGSENAPVCLTGANVAPVTTSSTSLVLNEGTTLCHEKSVLNLASLEAANNVTWQRPSATESDFELFNVAGDISLTGTQTLEYGFTPSADMTLFSYGGVCNLADISWVINAPKGDKLKVKDFTTEKKVKVTRIVGLVIIIR